MYCFLPSFVLLNNLSDIDLRLMHGVHTSDTFGVITNHYTNMFEGT